MLADKIQRQFPKSFNPVTQETFHPSVLKQDKIRHTLKDALDEYPELLADLMPLEQELKVNWPFVSDASGGSVPNMRGNKTAQVKATRHKSLMVRTRDVITRRSLSDSGHVEPAPTISTMLDSPKSPKQARSWLTRLTEDTSFGAFVREIVDKK